MPEKRVTARQKRAVFEHAHDCCEYCLSQAQFAVESFFVEHIVPAIRGGKIELDNLALSCQGCNNHRYTKIEGRDPATGELTPLYHPRRQPWQEHFAWNDDYTLIIGLTATGRATVAALQLNRENLIRLRWVLYAMGQHPPAEVDEP